MPKNTAKVGRTTPYSNPYGGFYVVNLYAHVATHPKDLKKAHWPTGGALADTR